MSELTTGTETIEVICRNNGPYRITGKFTLKDGAGNSFDLSKHEGVSLCRCGHSRNKPFCDGSHKASPFESVVQASP